MKKFLGAALAVLLVLGTLAGCGSKKEEEKTPVITPLPTAAPTEAPTPSPTPEHGPTQDSMDILSYTLPDWDYKKTTTHEDEFHDGLRIQTATYSFNQDGRMIHLEVLETEEYNSYSPAHYADMILTANVQELGEGYVLPLLEKYDVYSGVLYASGNSNLQYVSGYFRAGDNQVVMVEIGLLSDDIETVWDAFEEFLSTIQISE